MANWTRATLVSGHPIYLDTAKAVAGKRVRGQGKEFTAIYFAGNSEPFEIIETPEDLLCINPKTGAI